MFDEIAKSPWFRYREAEILHEVWFEDVRSVQARLQLVKEFGLAGISFWSINQLFRPGLLLLQNMYSVEKLI